MVIMDVNERSDVHRIESLLFDSEIEDDSYLNFLLASTSSSDNSEEECRCSCEAEKPTKRPKRTDGGFAESTVPKLNPDDFKNYFRVNRTTSVKLSEMIQNDFASEQKIVSEMISPEKATLVLLWYLGNQETLEQVCHRFNMNTSCVQQIVKTGVRSLSCKTSEHVVWPSSSSGEYLAIASSFRDTCELSDVIGAIGVSHIKIPKPKHNCKAYANENGYSVAVQGVVTINRKFIDFYVIEGSAEPADILKKSSIPVEAINGLFENHSLIGHKGYPKHRWLIQPIEDRGNLGPREKHLNMCYETGFSIVAQAFGSLKGRFQHLQHIESTDVLFVKQCVEAACVIHNFCIDCEDDDENLFCQDTGLLE